MGAMRSDKIRFWVTGFYLFAALIMGVGHRPLAITSDPLAAFVLPDGSRPVLCLTTKALAPGETDAPVHVEHCDACSLASAPGLAPVDVSYVIIERDGHSSKLAPENEIPIRRLHVRGHNIRGPPPCASVLDWPA